ncbi:MAG: YggT family protein [Spirochaetia bacterium]|jgi:YggT family protein|nr:YggT family protein [Spirochaetia bacterium]
MFSSVMTACSTIVSIYTLIIIAHIMMSWFAGFSPRGRVFRFIAAITEPYLNFFRGFRFLHIGAVDFSPVFALIVLSVLGNVFLSLAEFRQLSFGLVLGILVLRLWAAVAFFIGLYVFLVVLRIVGLLARLNSASPFWRYVDMVLNPVLLPLARLVFRGRRVAYLTALVSGGMLLLALRFGGAFLVEQLVLQIQKIPF